MSTFSMFGLVRVFAIYTIAACSDTCHCDIYKINLQNLKVDIHLGKRPEFRENEHKLPSVSRN